MKVANLSDMVGGWFVGNFDPSILKNTEFEVSVKYYKKGDVESAHLHKLAIEITVVVSGIIEMCDQEFGTGEIVMLDKSEATAFRALTDAITVVVKTPSITDDKYFV